MLVLDNLTKRYNNVNVVNNLTLQVPKGKIFGFLGPNGSGKTTTIQMIMNLIRPESGHIYFNNKDIKMLLSKNKVSYIPDEPFYYGRLTGNEFIKFACACKEIEYTQISNKIKKLWESFRFSDKDRNKFIEEYSRGMKKKLNIIIAIINTPDFLIMDEPTESLDPNATKVLKNYITNLKKNDCTVFLSTHLLDTAEYFCDFIGIIKEGNLIFNGSIETLKKNLKRPNSTLEEMFLQITGEENLMM